MGLDVETLVNYYLFVYPFEHKFQKNSTFLNWMLPKKKNIEIHFNVWKVPFFERLQLETSHVYQKLAISDRVIQSCYLCLRLKKRSKIINETQLLQTPLLIQAFFFF